MDYRLYLLGEDGKIKSADVIECPTDAAALEEAERRLPTCKYPVVEIWQRGRRVGTVGHAKARMDAVEQDRAASLF